MSEIRLDLRGMRCPWPALRVARVLRELGAAADRGTTIVALADDPAAPREIEAVAAGHGWRMSRETSESGVALRLIAKGS